MATKAVGCGTRIEALCPYFTGDGAKVDDEGHFWLLGRVDDVMNVSGHRVSTMEVESALVDPLVAEAAVIGCPHEIKGARRLATRPRWPTRLS